MGASELATLMCETLGKEVELFLEDLYLHQRKGPKTKPHPHSTLLEGMCVSTGGMCVYVCQALERGGQYGSPGFARRQQQWPLGSRGMGRRGWAAANQRATAGQGFP